MKRKVQEVSFLVSSNVTDHAWLAGLIDGDGSFYKTNGTGTNGKQYTTIRMVVAMNHKATIEHIVDLFDGLCAIHTTNTKRQKQMWFWRCSGDHLRVVLPLILPYLVTKKVQGLIFTELLELRLHSSAAGIHKPERQEELFEQLRKANAR